MKRCPQCGQTYNDGSLSFCLMDGAPLAETDSEPTVVIGASASSIPTVTSVQPPTGGNPSTPTQQQWGQSPPPKSKGSRMFLWVGLLVVIILLGGGAFVGLLIYLSGRGDNARVNLPGNVSSSPSPKRVSTPKPSLSAAPASTPQEEPSKVTDDKDQDLDADEITPITWNTSAAGFKSEVGKTYRFRCPPDGTAGAIWGSDIYTSDSSICTAAVHSGLMTLEDGGTITIEFRPGRKIYGSTVRNGITSNTFGEYDKSFVVRAGD